MRADQERIYAPDAHYVDETRVQIVCPDEWSEAKAA